MKPIVMSVILKKEKMFWLSLSFEKANLSRRQMFRSHAVITGSIPVDLHRCLCIVSVEVLSGRGLCDRLITHLEESYRMSWV
jgi:citrate lyase synthetase